MRLRVRQESPTREYEPAEFVLPGEPVCEATEARDLVLDVLRTQLPKDQQIQSLQGPLLCCRLKLPQGEEVCGVCIGRNHWVEEHFGDGHDFLRVVIIEGLADPLCYNEFRLLHNS